MNETSLLHQRKRRMERDGIGVAAMNDKEKIAKAVGMLEVAKAICMNKTFSNEAVMVATALQITVDAVMSVLKDDE